MTPSVRIPVLVGLFLATVARAQVPVGPEFRVNTVTANGQESPAVAADGSGRFVVVWEGYQPGGAATPQISGQRYDAAGAPIGTEFQVNTATTIAQFSPQVAADAAGNFVVVWESLLGGGQGRGVLGRRFDDTGAPQGGDFVVNTYTTGDQSNPAVAVETSGEFMVTWESLNQDGSDFGIFGQRYDAGGSAQGGEFQVNTYTTNQQALPAVAFVGGGSFVVTWESVGQDGDGFGVFGQRFSANGAFLGSEFQVNSFTTGAEEAPSIAAGSGGAFVIVWSRTAGIFGRRFDAGGSPLGSEFPISDASGIGPAVTSDASGGFFVTWQGIEHGSPVVLGRRFDSGGAALTPVFAVSRGFGTGSAVGGDGGSFLVAYNGNDGDVYAQRLAPDAPVHGQRLAVKDNADVTRRSIRLTARDQNLSTAGLDPVAHGAFLQLFNDAGSGEAVCLPLPASGWTASGDPLRPTYLYRDTTYANGPCRVAKLRNGKVLSATCRAQTMPIAFSLDEPTQTRLGAHLLSAGTTYCALFGGTIVKDEVNSFVARDAAAPALCPTPPAACP